MKRFLIYLSYFTLIITAVFIAYLFYLSFYPFTIVKLNSFTVESKTVRRGELITYNLDFQKIKNYNATTRYYFVDGIIVQLEGSGILRSVGEYKTMSKRVVPTTIVPGTYKMRIELDYKITAWRTVSYVWESNTFEIL